MAKEQLGGSNHSNTIVGLAVQQDDGIPIPVSRAKSLSAERKAICCYDRGTLETGAFALSDCNCSCISWRGATSWVQRPFRRDDPDRTAGH
ncbi:MAG TPA: hypothetical protein VFC37_01230 [Terracidiphilus sp.]|nr:hypothetical protein [Terracidiphilus sp.]